MKRSVLVIAAAAACGAALGIGFDRLALAQQSGIKRTVLQRVDDPGAPNYEAVMGISELAPGATSGKHYHHGIEIGYVLEGTVALDQEGKPTVTAKSGDTLRNDGSVPHNARNVGPTPAKILAVYVVEKGKPLAEAAQ